MEKFVLTQSGKEVKVGEKLTVKVAVNTPFGVGTVTHEIPVNENTIPELVKNGVLKPIEGEGNFIPMDINFYIGKIAKRMNWKIEKTYNYLNNIDSIMPAAAFSMILKEIAIELDKKYEDHIENSPEIYTISALDGRITKVNKAHIKNYRNFAAFRSVSDARIACSILREPLKDMFKNERK